MRYPPRRPEDTPVFWQRVAEEFAATFGNKYPTGETYRLLDEAYERAVKWFAEAYPMVGPQVVTISAREGPWRSLSAGSRTETEKDGSAQ